MSIELIDYTVLVAFWLCFSRWVTILFQLPIFDNMTIPSVVKILSALIITYAFFPITKEQVLLDINYVGVDNFWYLTAFYTIVGIIIGHLVKTLMNIFIAAGSLITQQVGFGAVSYFDPSAGQRVGPFEQLIQWTMIVLIISSGALLPMFKGVISSFYKVHLYDLGKIATSPIFFFELFKSIFISSILLATPIIFTNVTLMSVLGIISRAVPQMNIIMVSFVVNIGMGLLVFLAISNEFFEVAFKIYTEKLGEWFQLIS